MMDYTQHRGMRGPMQEGLAGIGSMLSDQLATALGPPGTMVPCDKPGIARTFESGATRDTDEGKLDYEGFFSPWVLQRYAEYMHENRVQSDGELRDSDNWQKGIPREQYMKSMHRHFMEVWMNHRSGVVDEDALCALLFNVMGYLHEWQDGR